MKPVIDMTVGELRDAEWQCKHDLAVAGGHEATKDFRGRRINDLNAIHDELARRANNGEGRPSDATKI